MTVAQKRTSAITARYDWGLLSVVMMLLGLGLVMVFSASYARGLVGYGDAYYFATRQVLWGAVGVAVMLIAARVPYRWWERWSVPLMGLGLLALVTVLVFGADRFGSTRTYFSGSVQPAEPVAIITIIYISAWLASKGERIRDVRVGLLPFSVLMGAIAVLIVAQPKISTAILIVLTAAIMFFIAGAELKQLAVILLVGALTFGLVINYSGYAKGRLDRYMESLWNPMGSEEYQVQISVEALTRGGLVGQGVGAGTAQLPGYLPLSWSDNIYAVVGEELGLLGTLSVILLFALLAYRGLRIALRAPDNFGMLVAIGITSALILQALLNMAVVVAAAPPTGVTLPFISYGGSSLVTALGAIGILLSISYYSAPSGRPATARSAPPRTAVTGGGGAGGEAGTENYARFDFGWRNRRSRLSSPSRRRTTAESERGARPAGTREKRTRRAPTRSKERGGR
jgi:cell division protein FtsW